MGEQWGQVGGRRNVPTFRPGKTVTIRSCRWNFGEVETVEMWRWGREESLQSKTRWWFQNVSIIFSFQPFLGFVSHFDYIICFKCDEKGWVGNNEGQDEEGDRACNGFREVIFSDRFCCFESTRWASPVISGLITSINGLIDLIGGSLGYPSKSEAAPQILGKWGYNH